MLSEEQIQDLYTWIDEIPLSRPKRNISRDFSDAVLAAEIVRYFLPKHVDLHNYPPANGFSQKIYNWNTFSQKTLRRLNINLDDRTLTDLASAKQGTIEEVLYQLRRKMKQIKEGSQRSTPRSMKLGSNPSMYEENSNFSASMGIPPGMMMYPGQQNGSMGGPFLPLIQPQFAGLMAQQQGQQQQVPLMNMMRPQGQAESYGRGQNREDPMIRTKLAEKDKKISELNETVEILQLKIQKLEQLLQLKDKKIEELSRGKGRSR